MRTPGFLLQWTFLVIVLAATIAAEPVNPVLHGAAKLLPEIPSEHRLELIEVCAQRGELELLRSLQKAWPDKKSFEARQGRAWLALLDRQVELPKNFDFENLLTRCPNVEGLRKLLASHSFPRLVLLRAAGLQRDESMARLLIKTAEKAEDPDHLAIVKAYVRLGDLEQARLLLQTHKISNRALLALVGESVEAPVYYPDFRPASKAKLEQWRQECALMAAVDIHGGRVATASALIKKAWLSPEELSSAADLLAYRPLKIAVAKHFSNHLELGRLQLPFAQGSEIEKLTKHFANIPDNGDGYPDISYPFRLLEELNITMSRKCFDLLFRETEMNISGRGLNYWRYYYFDLEKIYKTWEPSSVLASIQGQSDPIARFEALLRLGSYYPSDTWPIQAKDQKYLDGL